MCPSLAEIGDPVDAVVIATPADTVPDIVEAAGRIGCGGAVVFAAEFAETGRDDRQQALIAAANKHALPVIGPNANGVVAAALAMHRCGVTSSTSARRWRRASQPERQRRRRQRSRAGADSTGTPWSPSATARSLTPLRLSLSSPSPTGVRSVALYLEDDGDGARWAEAFALCAERDVRIAVLKAGRSEAGAVAGGAHTASVAGDHRIFRALVEEAGGAWCHDPHELLETAKLLATPRPTKSGALAVGHLLWGRLGHHCRRS